MKLNKNKLLENRFGVIRGEGVVGFGEACEKSERSERHRCWVRLSYAYKEKLIYK